MKIVRQVIKIRKLFISTLTKINISTNPAKTVGSTMDKNDFLKNILQSPANKISIELSPDHDFNTELLAKLDPHFVSVTWLGSKYLTLPNHEIPAIVLAKKLCKKGYPVLIHLAGRNLNKKRLLDVLKELQNGGVKNILAVQGDWSHVLEKNDNKCDFPYAADLVSFIKKHFGNLFCVGVAGYPEKHSHSVDIEEDIKYLKQKVSAGADFILTQAAFEYDVFEKFAKTCREREINVPILPGIFIIKSYKSLINMAKWCDFQVPKHILEFVEKHQEKQDVVETFGLDLAANLVKDISVSKNLDGVHIFSMNDLDLVANLIVKL